MATIGTVATSASFAQEAKQAESSDPAASASTVSTPAYDPAFNIATKPADKMGADWWAARHKQLSDTLAQSPCDVLMVGDSITHQWDSAGKDVWGTLLAPYNPVNFGIGGDETQHVLWRMEDSKLKSKTDPKVCFIHIGTNNTGVLQAKQDPKNTAEGIEAIALKLLARYPKTHVVILPIFPRGANSDDVLRKHNDLVNAELKKIDNPRISLLPMGDKFLKPDGTFLDETAPDLLHFSPKGYIIWAEAILPTIKKYVGDRSDRKIKSPDKPKYDPAASVAAIPLGNTGSEGWMGRHKQMCDYLTNNESDVLFLGDSITHFWEGPGKPIWETLLAPYRPANFGISGDHTQSLLWRVEDYKMKSKIAPKVCFIHIGTNNTGHYQNRQDPKNTAEGIKAVADKLVEYYPDTHVVILSIFPRGLTKTDPSRQHNDLINAELKKLKGKSKSIEVLDIGDAFLNPDGTFIEGVAPDLLHLSTKGYIIWAQAVLPTIRKYVPTPAPSI